MVKVHLKAVVKVRVGQSQGIQKLPEGSAQGKKVPGRANRKEFSHFPVASMFQEELTWELMSVLNLHVSMCCGKTLEAAVQSWTSF